MKKKKEEILDKLSYTELVYGRIRKKLSVQMRDEAIEEFIFDAVKETPLNCFEKRGKNFYISNFKKGVRITVNSYTFRVITADKYIRKGS